MWGGEVAGVCGGLAVILDRRILILSDSRAVIAMVREAGRTGRARARDLVDTMDYTGEVSQAWVRRCEARLGQGPRWH